MTDFRTVEEKAIHAGLVGTQAEKALRQLLLLLKSSLANRPPAWATEEEVAAGTEALKPALYAAKLKIDALDILPLATALDDLTDEIEGLLGPDYEPPSVDPEAV